jgi:hypothetical protein
VTPTAPALPVPAHRKHRRDRGYVTAETAVAVPALVLLAAALMWAIAAVGGEVRCVDAARAGARAAARSEPEAVVIAVARAAAPCGARVSVRREGDLVRVRVTARSVGPGRLAAALSVRLHAEAVALAEDTVGGGGGGAPGRS